MANEFEFRGAASEFDYLIEQMSVLESRKFLNTLLDEMSKAALKLIQQEFETSTDPTGKPWAPFKRKREKNSGRKLLLKSRDLFKSIRRQVQNDGFKIVSTDPKFRFHQWGTKFLPQRMIFPVLMTESGLPANSNENGDDLDAFVRVMRLALQKAAQKLDLDIFEEGGGVSVFEQERNFRDDY